MDSFVNVTAVAAPLEGNNIDTDQIIPARFMKLARGGGYGRFLFHDHRFAADGAELPGFVLNQAAFRAARILVAGSNFGCGSSRESAVYALRDFGIRAVIAPGFGDIFHANALKNGLIPVTLPADVTDGLRRRLLAGPDRDVTVDLQAQTAMLPGGVSHPFAIDPFWRECIMKGIDEIEMTLNQLERIEAFERQLWNDFPWTERSQGTPEPIL